MNAVSALRAQFDPQHGGFGRAPKFPPTRTSSCCFGQAATTRSRWCSSTLDGMAAGGMYDVIGESFRYSVDEAWLVPHFEKMLYDNALLAPTYLHAWLVTGEERYRRIAEGRSTTWSATCGYRKEVRLGAGCGYRRRRGPHLHLDCGGAPKALGEPHADWLQPFEHGRFVIRGEVPEEARALLEVRAAYTRSLSATTRPSRPGTAWRSPPSPRRLAGSAARTTSGVMARSASRASSGRLSRIGRAAWCARTRDRVARSTGIWRTMRTWPTATSSCTWPQGIRPGSRRPIALTQHAQAFADPERGGWFVGDHHLVARRKEFDDHPTPSGNSMMAFVALRHADLGRRRAQRGGSRRVPTRQAAAQRAPTAFGNMLYALDFHFATPRKWRSWASPSFAPRP